MGEHLPYKQGVTGSSPVPPTQVKLLGFYTLELFYALLPCLPADSVSYFHISDILYTKVKAGTHSVLRNCKGKGPVIIQSNWKSSGTDLYNRKYLFCASSGNYKLSTFPLNFEISKGGVPEKHHKYAALLCLCLAKSVSGPSGVFQCCPMVPAVHPRGNDIFKVLSVSDNLRYPYPCTSCIPYSQVSMFSVSAYVGKTAHSA